MKRSSLALIITVIIWGTTYVVTKSALTDIGPFSLTYLRFIIALVALLPIALKQGFSIRKAFRAEFFLFGLTGVAIFFGFQNLALVFTSSANASMILASVPAITTILAVILLKERPHRLQWIGIACAVAGIWLVSLFASQDTFSPAPLLGNLLLVGSALAWGFYTIQSRHMSSRYPAIHLSAGSIITGLIILTPFALAELITAGPPEWTTSSTIILVYLGLAASGLTFYLWNYALHKIPASQAAPYMNLIPVVGLSLALLAGESLNLPQWLGGMLALTGVWLNNRFAR